MRGQYKPIVARVQLQMQSAAQQMQYEKAGELRDAIRDIMGLMEQQNVLQTRGGEQDILAVSQDSLDAMVQVLFVRSGKMIGGDAYALPREGNEPEADVLEGFLTQFYEDRRPAREVIVSALRDDGTMEAWLRSKRDGAVDLVMHLRGS